MNQFDYVHVALHGHFDNKLSVRFTFNGSHEGTPRWEGSLPDPEAIVRNFVSARECYVMWHNAHGHYFGVITSDPLDPRAGKVMVTLMINDGDAVAGRAVFSALSALKKAFLEDRQMTAETVRQVLLSVDFPQQPRKLASWAFDAEAAERIPAASIKPLCYRTYLSTRELETVFSFPDQTEYERYIYKVVITATASLRPGVAVDRLTAPVKKVYSLICPEGVQASQDVVAEGDHVSLTFSKEGFTPRKETFTVGTISPYVRTEGSAMIVKTPAESGMGFTRKVHVSVKSSKGTMVNGYTMSVNDRPVNTMESHIELTEADLESGRKVEIQVASNNFRPLKKQYEPSELNNGSSIDLVLVPFEEGIILRLDFGEGRVFEEQISIEKNTPEYSQLHSGNFHGFRAHRQASQGEIYNVDVRASSKPVAPSFDRAATATADTNTGSGRVVPHFEKVEPARKKDRIDLTVPGRNDAEKTPVSETAGKTERKSPFMTGRNDRKQDKEKKNNDDASGSRNLKIICLIVSVLAVIAGAIYIIRPLIGTDDSAAPQGENTEMTAAPQGDEEAQAAAIAAQTPQAGAPDNAPAAAAPAKPGEPTADEKADYDYFNKNEVWKRSDLRSDAGRSLYDALSRGDIDAIARSEYFIVEGRATNKKALKMIDWAWASKGTLSQTGNENAIKKNVNDERADIANAYEDVARRQPSEPNKTPRPVRN